MCVCVCVCVIQSPFRHPIIYLFTNQNFWTVNVINMCQVHVFDGQPFFILLNAMLRTYLLPFNNEASLSFSLSLAPYVGV